MFGIGSSEFLVILLVAVVVLGPEHLPRIMRTFNKVMGDVRRVSTDFQRTLNLEANQEEYLREQAAKPKVKKKKKPAPPVAEETAEASAQTNASEKPAAAATDGNAENKRDTA